MILSSLGGKSKTITPPLSAARRRDEDGGAEYFGDYWPLTLTLTGFAFSDISFCHQNCQFGNPFGKAANFIAGCKRMR
jgi:hypothetical protein